MQKIQQIVAVIQQLVAVVKQLISDITTIAWQLIKLIMPAAFAVIALEAMGLLNLGITKSVLATFAVVGLSGNVLTVIVIVALVLWYERMKK